ncbi:DUF3376 domain-containing protein [bacterium]|nr:DUF3376 domain-containing protein [bacterium]
MATHVGDDDKVREWCQSEQIREVRLAVAMVGGTSLAVHINGTTQELNNMVMGKGAFGLAKKLTASHAYVDVLSGTSAGGLNAVFLATALANQRNVNKSTSLFRNDADIDALLFAPEEQSESLMKGEGHILPQVRLAFHQIVSSAKEAGSVWSGRDSEGNYGDIDLFVTGSYLSGQPRNFFDSLRTPIYTKTHKAVFHFRHRSSDPKKSDFDLTGNDARLERLARAARTTSSLPAVFEPSEVTSKVFDGNQTAFKVQGAHHYMGDGGYWNGRPLDLIVQAVVEKVASRRVDRKVLLVEPAPDQPTLLGEEPKMSALGHLLAYREISSSQSLFNTLEDAARHNRQVESVNSILESIKVAEGSIGLPQIEIWARLRTLEMVERICDILRLKFQGMDFDLTAFRTVLLTKIQALCKEADDSLKLPLDKIDPYFTERLLLRAQDRLYERMGPKDSCPRKLRDINDAYTEFLQIKTTLRTELEDFFSELTDISSDQVREEAAQKLLLAADGHCKTALLDFQKRADGCMPDNALRQEDVWLYPVERASGIPNRETLDMIMIDPKVKLGLSDRPEDLKVAGSALFKFGGFLSRTVRCNDLLWGRLDGCATLLKMLLWEEFPKKMASLSPEAKLGVLRYLRCGEWHGDQTDEIGRYLEKGDPSAAEVDRLWNPEGVESIIQLIVLRHQFDILKEEIPKLLAADLVESLPWGEDPPWVKVDAAKRFLSSEAARPFLSSQASGVLREFMALCFQGPVDVVKQGLEGRTVGEDLLDLLHANKISQDGVKRIPVLVQIRRGCQLGLAALKCVNTAPIPWLDRILRGVLSPLLRTTYSAAWAAQQNQQTRMLVLGMMVTVTIVLLGLGFFLSNASLFWVGMSLVAAGYAVQTQSWWASPSLWVAFLLLIALRVGDWPPDGPSPQRIFTALLPLSAFFSGATALRYALTPAGWKSTRFSMWDLAAWGTLVATWGSLVVWPGKARYWDLAILISPAVAYAYHKMRFGFLQRSISHLILVFVTTVLFLAGIAIAVNTAILSRSLKMLSLELTFNDMSSTQGLQDALAWDNSMAVAYAGFFAIGCLWLHYSTRLRWFRLMARFALLAGACDLIENSLLLHKVASTTIVPSLFIKGDGFPDWLLVPAWLISYFATAKFVLIGPPLVCGLIGFFSAWKNGFGSSNSWLSDRSELLEYLEGKRLGTYTLLRQESYAHRNLRLSADLVLKHDKGQTLPLFLGPTRFSDWLGASGQRTLHVGLAIPENLSPACLETWTDFAARILDGQTAVLLGKSTTGSLNFTFESETWTCAVVPAPPDPNRETPWTKDPLMERFRIVVTPGRVTIQLKTIDQKANT